MIVIHREPSQHCFVVFVTLFEFDGRRKVWKTFLLIASINKWSSLIKIVIIWNHPTSNYWSFRNSWCVFITCLSKHIRLSFWFFLSVHSLFKEGCIILGLRVAFQGSSSLYPLANVHSCLSHGFVFLKDLCLFSTLCSWILPVLHWVTTSNHDQTIILFALMKITRRFNGINLTISLFDLL